MINRHEVYNQIKHALCNHGAIPPTEKQYEALIHELLDLIANKPV